MLCSLSIRIVGLKTNDNLSCLFVSLRSLRTKETAIHRHLYLAMLIQVVIRLVVYTDQVCRLILCSCSLLLLLFSYECFYTIGNIFFQRSRISKNPLFEHSVSNILNMVNIFLNWTEKLKSLLDMWCNTIFFRRNMF